MLAVLHTNYQIDHHIAKHIDNHSKWWVTYHQSFRAREHACLCLPLFVGAAEEERPKVVDTPKRTGIIWVYLFVFLGAPKCSILVRVLHHVPEAVVSASRELVTTNAFAI